MFKASSTIYSGYHLDIANYKERKLKTNNGKKS